MKTARDVIADLFLDWCGTPYAFEKMSDNQKADKILAALAAAGFKVLGREPTHSQVVAGIAMEPEPSIVTFWQTLFDAAEPGKPWASARRYRLTSRCRWRFGSPPISKSCALCVGRVLRRMTNEFLST